MTTLFCRVPGPLPHTRVLVTCVTKERRFYVGPDGRVAVLRDVPWDRPARVVAMSIIRQAIREAMDD